MVWCCFFVRTQVSSLRQDQGWMGSQFPPKPGWTMPGAEVWEGAAVCISQETDQGAAQSTWTVEATSASLKYVNQKRAVQLGLRRQMFVFGGDDELCGVPRGQRFP